jgi:hypothetical protein
VKHSSLGKNHHQQLQGQKLKSIITDPARREVPPRHVGFQVRFADSRHVSPSATVFVLCFIRHLLVVEQLVEKH